MCALCNGVVVKLVLTVAGFLLSGTHAPALFQHASAAPPMAVCAPAAADTLARGTAAVPQKPAKVEKPEKQTKITISDEGIQIESEGSEKVILGLDEKTRARISGQAIDNLQNLPESLDAVFGEDENKQFYNVKGSDLVQFGKRIIVGPHELVNGDVVAIGSDVIVEGKVMGDVAAIFGSVRLGPTAIVNGEVVSILGEVDRDDGAVVRGETAVIGRRHSNGLSFPIGPFGEGVFGAGAKVVTFIIGMLLMLIVLYFLSLRMTNAASYAASSLLKSFGVGLLVLFAGSVLVLILSIILAITIVGIPVALLLVFSFIALFVIGFFVAALALGTFACRKFHVGSDSVYVRGFIGLFLLAILGIIASFMFFTPWMGPFRAMLRVFGGLLSFVAVVTGVGAFILSRGGSIAGRPEAPLPEKVE